MLPSILDGLADEKQFVQDAVLSARHVVIEHYAITYIGQEVKDGRLEDQGSKV